MRPTSSDWRTQPSALFNTAVALGFALTWMSSLEGRLSAGTLDYADYPAPSVFHGPPAKPKFKPGTDTWPDADPRFRVAVQFDVAKGANFAGAYTIVRTSCGTGCFYVVVVDVRTGDIFEDLTFRMVVVGRPDEYSGLSFRLNSRLLIVEGLVDGSHKPTRSYYQWGGTGFRLIKTVRIAPH
jgi:hypothetical protein